MAGSRSGKVAALVLVPAAVLVAAFMLVMRMRVQPLTVPPYHVVPQSSAEPALHPGDKLRLTLEPEGQLTGAIGGRVFLVSGTGVRGVDAQPHFSIDRDGTMHLEADASALFAGVPAGDWDLAIAVGRPEMLPRAPSDALRPPPAGAQGAPWFLVRQRVHFGG